MQPLIDFIANNPWFWVVGALGLAVWVGALVVIFRSPKFIRKWLWVLLTFVQFTFSWSASENLTIGIGIPLGALYVLWFWRFGKAPTPEQIAQAEAKAAERRAAPYPHAKSRMAVEFLRVAYLLAAVAAGMVSWMAASGAMFRLIVIPGEPDAFPSEMMLPIQVADGVFGVALAGLFVFLSFRPYPWGKVVCALCAVAWTGFVIPISPISGMSGGLALVLGSGLSMAAAAITVQVIDRRFGGPYLRKP